MRNATHRGNGEYIRIAVVFAGEGDRRPVRRKNRRIFQTHSGGQADRAAAFARNRPKISRISKRDQFPAKGGRLKQVGLPRGGVVRGGGGE